MGSNLFNIEDLVSFSERKIQTKFGDTYLKLSEKCVLLPRHGPMSNIPPHMINHRANMIALRDLGVENVISFTSVGSLNLDLEPTFMIMPDDYINMGEIFTYFNTERKHIIPGLDNELRKQIFEEVKELDINIKFNGIYIQTRGPRIETGAEINMLKSFGDVVGMTMASEATLAKELEIGYANISIIDNYCNGITDGTLTIESIKENQKRNARNIEKIIEKLLASIAP